MKLSIATMTLARNDPEESLLRESLAALAEIGASVAVCDGGSRSAFIEFLQRLPNFTVVATRQGGLVAQIRSSLQAALEAATPFVVYTEPDKTAFFRRHLRNFAASAPDDPAVGAVLAARSAAAFATFPPMQRFTETTANELCAERCALATDYFYGPFLLRRELVEEIDDLPGRIGWGWRPFLFARAVHRGYRVVSWTGDFECPPDQRQEDEAERLHRVRQLNQNVDGLILAAERATAAERRA
jgi:hypothetical protein